MNTIIRFSGETEETTHNFEIVSSEMELIEKYKPELIAALNTVDAQFYYSNPLILVIIDAERQIDISKCGICVRTAFKMNVQAHIIATALFGMPNASITRNIYVSGPSGSGSGS